MSWFITNQISAAKSDTPHPHAPILTARPNTPDIGPTAVRDIRGDATRSDPSGIRHSDHGRLTHNAQHLPRLGCPESAGGGGAIDVPRNALTDRSDIRRARCVQIRH